MYIYYKSLDEKQRGVARLRPRVRENELIYGLCEENASRNIGHVGENLANHVVETQGLGTWNTSTRGYRESTCSGYRRVVEQAITPGIHQ